MCSYILAGLAETARGYTQSHDKLTVHQTYTVHVVPCNKLAIHHITLHVHTRSSHMTGLPLTRLLVSVSLSHLGQV